jgi:hypothetical protein
MGRVWCLDLGVERRAVKELFGESEEESVRLEVTFTAHLESAGIRLPGSVPGRGGRFLQVLAADDGGGGRWLRLYRWIDGVPVDLADPGLPVQIGDLVGRLHALAPPAWGAVDPWYDSVPEPATWDQLADAAHGQRAGWADAMAEHAGGPGRLRDEQSFGMYIACRLNFLEGQASVALDPGTAPEDRAYASSEISDTLARLPTRSMISHLTSLAAATLG